MDIWAGFTLNRKEAVYLQLMRRVRQLVAAGKLENGAALPSRRETAAQLEINPNTVQKAYKLLEEEGLLATEGNSGSIIRCTEEIRSKIGSELMREAGAEFVRSAKEMRLSYKQVIDLLSELWEEP